MDKEIIKWLIKHAEYTEWQTRNAAENQYCMYCDNQDPYSDQSDHDNNCEYVKMMKLANNYLNKENKIT